MRHVQTALASVQTSIIYVRQVPVAFWRSLKRTMVSYKNKRKPNRLQVHEYCQNALHMEAMSEQSSDPLTALTTIERKKSLHI